MEIFLLPIALALLIGQQLIAGFIAKNNGRSFRYWFWISFLIPVLSIIILMCLEDKNPEKKIPLADHVERD